jgi:hypothetical protein
MRFDFSAQDGKSRWRHPDKIGTGSAAATTIHAHHFPRWIRDFARALAKKRESRDILAAMVTLD